MRLFAARVLACLLAAVLSWAATSARADWSTDQGEFGWPDVRASTPAAACIRLGSLNFVAGIEGSFGTYLGGPAYVSLRDTGVDPWGDPMEYAYGCDIWSDSARTVPLDFAYLYDCSTWTCPAENPVAPGISTGFYTPPPASSADVAAVVSWVSAQFTLLVVVSGVLMFVLGVRQGMVVV